MNRWKVLAGVLVTIAVVGAAYMGYRNGSSEENLAPPAPATVAVTRGGVQQTVVAPGLVAGTREVVLGMDTGGRLDAINVRPGAVVEPCDEIAQLDTEPLEEALEAARLDRAQRFQEGFWRGLDLDVDRAEADLVAATLTAPFHGVVLDVMAREGDMVGPGTPIAILSDPLAVEVRTTVIEEDLPLVQVGQTVGLFFDAQPDATLDGQVTRIVPQRVPGENRPLYHVYVSLDDPPEGVVAGMTADASIIVDQRENVLRLPRAMVRGSLGGESKVDVWANGESQERRIKLGLRGDVNVEVLDGLGEGDMVVSR